LILEITAFEMLVAFAGSFAAGALGAAVGLVLGTLRLPLILLLSGDAASAAGTNVAISAASAGSGSVEHAREGRVDWRVVGWMLPPTAAGAIVGALFGDSAPERLLYGLIAAVLLWNGADLLLRPFRSRPRSTPRVGAAAATGFGVGLLGGAVGVILGTLRMPALLAVVGMTAHRAVGTNLVVGFALGLAAFATYALQLEIEWSLLAAGIAGALPGGWLGARLTGRASEELLRRAIGVALVAVGVAFAVEVVVG
jgi:uncharacterized membrane protein YfcA